MGTIRYTGEDIPADSRLSKQNGMIINPNSPAGIKVYVFNSNFLNL
jgi:hypothetical protein